MNDDSKNLAGDECVIGYLADDLHTLTDICKAINRTIGKVDPFSDLIFHPWHSSDEGGDDVDWIVGIGMIDASLRLTFYAVVVSTDETGIDCGLWLIHLHKATGHVLAMKVQGETEPSLHMQTLAMVVPSLAIAELRDL